LLSQQYGTREREKERKRESGNGREE